MTGRGGEARRIAADAVKKVTTEPDGHAPAIVHADADPVATPRRLAANRFRNGGQVCIPPSRFCVRRSILPASATAFLEVARSIRLGDGPDPATAMGPMIRAQPMDAGVLTGGRDRTVPAMPTGAPSAS